MASNVAALAVLLSVVSLAQAQQAPTPDNHPSLPTWKCTTAGGCVQQQTSLVVDWVYHWIHQINGSTSCSLTSGCTDATTCYQDCEISPATYSDLGIQTSGSAVTLNQYVNGTSASPRVYLLDPSGQDYEMLQLTGQEISFDVDVSNLPCGENGALYLSEMSATGGRSATNPAGASYGSGYCDAQCGSSSWFNGAPNPSGLGSCCNEMDLWEANSEATALTPHSCTVEGPYGCTGTACGSSGVCDKDGCGFNPYAMGNHSFYGPSAGSVIDTSKPFTVTTQFLTTDGTKTGSLSEIRRYYTQNGQVIANSVSTASGVAGDNSLTPAFCQIEDSAMASQFGGFNAIGGALSRGMVLIFSIWNDNSQNMNWLDSGNSGPCSSTAGNPATILANDPGTSVTFSNIKWGDLGSTFGGSGTGLPSSTTTTMTTTTTTSASTTTSTTTPTTTSPAGPAQTHWGQCGGQGWTGPTTCQSPYTCQVSNPWYSQCL